jgi:hypothetical protein
MLLLLREPQILLYPFFINITRLPKEDKGRYHRYWCHYQADITSMKEEHKETLKTLKKRSVHEGERFFNTPD